jgi:hypothetical protein
MDFTKAAQPARSKNMHNHGISLEVAVSVQGWNSKVFNHNFFNFFLLCKSYTVVFICFIRGRFYNAKESIHETPKNRYMTMKMSTQLFYLSHMDDNVIYR